MFSRFMRNLKFGRSLVIIVVSFLIMLVTFMITDVVTWEGKMKVVKAKYNSGIELVMTKTDGSKAEFITSSTGVVESYFNDGIKEFNCRTFRDVKTLSCDVPKK